MPVILLKEFERWDFYSPLNQKLQMVDASDTPFITYDNNEPCFEANMYMHKQLKAVKSRRVKGGTLRTYATQVHHLVRFCYQNKMPFSQLTDSTFTLFVQGLQAERDKCGELVRSNNHVIQIAHRCLDFLSFVQDYHDLDNFIGKGKENAIRVTIKKYKISIEGSSQKKEVEVVSHTCVPTKDAVNRKFPVSEDSALKVWEHVRTQENREKRLRDIALYQCLEQLGGRVTEIHLITMKDIDNAIKSGKNPHLTLTTLKRRDDDITRSIPVTSALLADIKQYINKVRKKIIKRTIGKANDHGYLFVSLTTGQPLQSATLTRYMNTWKNELGIEGELHPHLYRHAFITNKLKEIILQHKEITSADKFREHLLHTEHFKMQLQQWTGHTKHHSLDTYINLVFSDLNGYSEAYNAVQLNDSVKIVKRQVQRIRQQLKDKEVTMTEGLLLIDLTLSAFEHDIAQSLNIISK
ncbi:tyrosine-type recombinase/integrase [Photobacterium sanguinicancri]|uniref:Integrase n=1 Tax=Photobacterium sanguinicancri TaxID=875932 RepID=A0ABX4FUY5_9GAMM|nr:tyrosine-type recombinase/integrase [Photobacterium sanguinicancri]OZS42682.1 integrase [Photobacterium sanguinicancri]